MRLSESRCLAGMPPESEIKRRSPEQTVPRLAQLARAPDCRLKTHGCRQPSGGPRFKSGSADHHTVRTGNSRCNLHHTFAFSTAGERALEGTLPSIFAIL